MTAPSRRSWWRPTVQRELRVLLSAPLRESLRLDQVALLARDCWTMCGQPATSVAVYWQGARQLCFAPLVETASLLNQGRRLQEP